MNQKAAQITFGADPEFFLTTTDGVPVPVCGWLGGEKGKPINLDYCGILEDGVAVELNILPSPDPANLVQRLRYGLNEAVEYANRRFRHGVLALSHASALLFPADALRAAGPAAHVFGCAPDFDAYQQGAQSPTVDTGYLRDVGGEWRFAGGHIHIGYKNLRPDVPEVAVAMLCDAFIGHPLVVNGEVQGRRRFMYGMPGRFRSTEYGIEYRTPSNGWLMDRGLRDVATHGMIRLRNVLTKPSADIRSLWNSAPWRDVHTAIAHEDTNSRFNFIV
jgi:hypothetical protein